MTKLGEILNKYDNKIADREGEITITPDPAVENPASTEPAEPVKSCDHEDSDKE